MKASGLFCILLFLWLTAACQLRQTNFSDISGHVKSIPVTPSEERSYFYPVWLSDKTITFLVFPAGDSFFSGNSDNPELRLYNSVNDNWSKVYVQPDTTCRWRDFNFLQRLPSQRLGFVETCSSYDLDTIVKTIREMDLSTGESNILIEPLVEIRNIGPFSYSSDMTELIQEDMANHILGNKLFYRQGKNLIQIVPNFIRAMHPAWSPHDRQIAFWGTENYPGKKPGEFKTLSDISELALYPWDLYISDPEGGNIRKLLSSVQGALTIKWSPQENIIAFSGTVEGVPGIWLIDPETSALTHVWAVMGDFDFFDWSPNGKKMVVVNSDLDEEFKVTGQEINIIYLDIE